MLSKNPVHHVQTMISCIILPYPIFDIIVVPRHTQNDLIIVITCYIFVRIDYYIRSFHCAMFKTQHSIQQFCGLIHFSTKLLTT